jgi:hypothetical protein
MRAVLGQPELAQKLRLSRQAAESAGSEETTPAGEVAAGTAAGAESVPAAAADAVAPPADASPGRHLTAAHPAAIGELVPAETPAGAAGAEDVAVAAAAAKGGGGAGAEEQPKVRTLMSFFAKREAR